MKRVVLLCAVLFCAAPASADPVNVALTPPRFNLEIARAAQGEVTSVERPATDTAPMLPPAQASAAAPPPVAALPPSQPSATQIAQQIKPRLPPR